ncbi:MAG: acyl-CoA dehydrogenase [Oscillospiraceae bacterium]|nr:acyl-CoA dehydrogenase [Oscillospiraceae bacterium]MDE6839397.1 acyl-CoA dehydrogenase family protein [Oscillospiraceae bacterium]
MSEYALLTEEQAELKKMIRTVLEKELAPLVKEYDVKSEFPMQVFRKLGEIGLWGMDIPAEYGGPGFDAKTLCLLREEFGRVDAGFSVSFGASTVGFKIMTAGGSEEQKHWVADQIIQEGRITAMCITESQGGSDVAATRTKAVRDGDEYVINGVKTFITNGSLADIYIVVASTAPELRGKGLSCFIVERDRAGVSVGKEEDKMGIRLSNTTDVIFEDVRVPADHLIGRENEGFKYVMKALEKSRPIAVGPVVGLAQAALDAAIQYSKERVVFGKPIGQNQGIRFMLADMEMRVEAARQLMLYACDLIDAGRPIGPHGSIAKTYASEAAVRVTNDALQIFGGYGYSREYPIEKMVRDARIYTIFEGANQIQRDIIGKTIIGK